LVLHLHETSFFAEEEGLVVCRTSVSGDERLWTGPIWTPVKVENSAAARSPLIIKTILKLKTILKSCSDALIFSEIDLSIPLDKIISIFPFS